MRVEVDLAASTAKPPSSLLDKRSVIPLLACFPSLINDHGDI